MQRRTLTRRAEPSTPAQAELFATLPRRGGKRPGAGRPPKGARAGMPHLTRPDLAARFPVHVVLRRAPALGTLRRLDFYAAIRKATTRVAQRKSFRIVHLSIQRSHIHLLVEANDKVSLSRGMQAFQISAAKQLNRAFSRRLPGPRRRGAVFPDRYYAEIIRSPQQARHALSYVLNNWRKHHEDREDERRGWKIDWYSSAGAFACWAEAEQEPWMLRRPSKMEPLQVTPAATWLLDVGWKKHGSTISRREVPTSTR
ncbi:MAG TPA: transposase [Kofleriaceae bacterium]